MTPEPTLELGARPVAFGAARDSLTVGVGAADALGQLPILLATQAGYFEAAGFDAGISIVAAGDPLTELRSGGLDVAVVPMEQGYASFLEDPSIRAIAGHQSYTAEGGFGGDLLMASATLVEDDPATLIAFLDAYVQALDDLSRRGSAAQALEQLQAGPTAIDPELAADWDAARAVFAPFDGGFGDRDEEGGLGELATLLSGDDGSDPQLDDFIAAHTLNIAQARQGLFPNPDAGLVGRPTISDIRIGLPLGSAAVSPIVVAQESGYFEAAGFDSVEIIDVEQPLMGILQGQLDFGVVDAVDAADGVSQGLPIAAIAGHRDPSAEGSSGDLVMATTDLLDVDKATVTAFLIAYLQGLRDLADGPDGAAFAPHDGGFGARDDQAGLGQLQAYLAEVLGAEPDIDALIDPSALTFAQAWWGGPANPALPADVIPTAGEG